MKDTSYLPILSLVYSRLRMSLFTARWKNTAPSWFHSIQKSNGSYEDLNGSRIKSAETKCLFHLIKHFLKKKMQYIFIYVCARVYARVVSNIFLEYKWFLDRSILPIDRTLTKTKLSLSLSLFLTHKHTHTHIYIFLYMIYSLDEGIWIIIYMSICEFYLLPHPRLYVNGIEIINTVFKENRPIIYFIVTSTAEPKYQFRTVMLVQQLE